LSGRPQGARNRWARERLVAMVFGVVLLTGGDAVAATSDATTGRSLAGNFLAGEHARIVEDHSAAADFLKSVLANDPDDTELLQAAFTALSQEGRFGEAVPIAERLSQKAAGADAVELVLAMDAFKRGDFARAAQRIGKLPKGGLNDFSVPMLLAWVRLAEGDVAAARAALSPLATIEGVRPLHDLMLALLNDVAGDTAAADAGYRALAGQPDALSFRTLELAANHFLRRGDGEAAAKLIDDFNKIYPDNSLIGLLRTQLEQRPRPLVADARQGLAEAAYSIAAGLLQDGAEQPAMLFAQMALDLSPEIAPAHLLRGDLLAAAERFEKAVEAYGLVDPNSAYAWTARQKTAEAFDRLDRADEAVKVLQAMTEERMNVADAALALGNLLRSKERFAEAAVAYDKTIARIGAIKPHHWTLFYYRGISLERSNRWDRAEADFLKALEMEPDQPFVLNYLAYTWVTQRKNLDRALDMLKNAVKQRSEDGYIIDSLGWAYYQLGEYVKAVEYLERAVEFEPTDSEINEHLGDAYWKAGREAEARFQWRRALSFEPKPDRVAPLQSKMESGLTENPT
jgi:Flp pilus assembly protein TadD